MQTTVECLQCKMSEPMSEYAALVAVLEQDHLTPGLLAYYPCRARAGFHLTIAGARDDARRPEVVA